MKHFSDTWTARSFDGALASAVTLLRLGFKILGIISFEKDKTLRLLQRLRWPGVIFWDSTDAPLADFVRALASPFKALVDIVFVAGSIGRLHDAYAPKIYPIEIVNDIWDTVSGVFEQTVCGSS